MKFEDLLMQPNKQQQRRRDLEEEVVRLRANLDEEQKLSRVLECALHGIVLPRSSQLPLQVQVLLAELAIVEEEIICLERKVEELKLSLYQEMKQTKQCRIQQHRCRQRKQKYSTHGVESPRSTACLEQLPTPPSHSNLKNQRMTRERDTSQHSISDSHSVASTSFNGSDDIVERSRFNISQSHNFLHDQVGSETPNKLSEELIRCLISIFLKLNRTSLDCEGSGSAIVPKLTLSCMNSKSFISKTSFNCKAPMFFVNDNATIHDPYSILSDLEGTVRDVGPYKSFIQFTRSTLDISRVTKCFPAIGNVRVLMHKLCTVDLSSLTYKQKLAFWINIYNACVMNAFLQHGLPSTPDRLLALMNKAVLNVGGIVLNALAIEHFILRHPSDSKNFSAGAMDEKEMLLRHVYGLGYPEPNITFALCRGNWSSPALRVYTSEDVMNELGKATVEYLEASVGVTNKKKILLPKLLQWHMQDFADDIESLLEWIYSQLPHSGSLKRSIMECLNRDIKTTITKMVEIQPYKSEFRYLLSL